MKVEYRRGGEGRNGENRLDGDSGECKYEEGACNSCYNERRVDGGWSGKARDDSSGQGGWGE